MLISISITRPEVSMHNSLFMLIDKYIFSFLPTSKWMNQVRLNTFPIFSIVLSITKLLRFIALLVFIIFIEIETFC